MGRLVVHSSYPWLGFLFALTGVKVMINGHPEKVPWGEHPFDLPAGNYHLRVCARWFGEFGSAELPIAVYPSQILTVFYRPPSFKWARGAIGFTPQKSPGRVLSYTFQAIILVLVVLYLIGRFS